MRHFESDDWPAIHELYADPECTRYTFGRALNEAESWRAMASLAGHWLLRGYGPYAVVETSTGCVLGVAGLWYPADWPEPEIKWALRRCYWGRHFATEAARTLQRMLAEHWAGKPPISLIDANNAASIRVALAVGARFEREIAFRGSQWHVYRHPG